MIQYKANKQLAEQKQLSPERIDAIEEVGQELMRVCARPLHYDNHKQVVKIVEAMEATLQILWGFSYSPKHHYYQLEISGCTCPQADNLERIGHTETRVARGSCPFHGLTEEDEECS